MTTTYAVVNPVDGTRERDYPALTDAEVDAAVALAAGAHAGWSRGQTVAERAAVVRRIAELHVERREELAEIIVREMGKPIDSALGEVDFCGDIYSYYADNAEAFLGDESIPLLAGDGRAFIRRSSLGPILGIMPWNFPYYQVARFAAPNLILGNTILLKPAPQCPESAEALANLFRDAGAPAGVFVTLLASEGQIAGVIADPRVPGISLTGSERAGAAVAELAGRNLKRVVLELGGSDPFIVLSTDDMAATVESAITARMENSGQACNAAKRFIIVDHLYDEFVDAFAEAFAALSTDDPRVSGTVVGPLSSAQAADRLEQQVIQATCHGARIRVGGTRDGNFFTPTVLTDVSPQNPAYREEFFGPVATMYRVADEAAAVALANDTPFGLGSYLVTTDDEQALRVADQIEAGMVFVNVVAADGAELPFGGIKRSGTGRELGRLGADEFANKKLIRIG
ncbi:NAD-dependent succinate-semialdehyde dehydrogenase [Microbacterium terricola]|nr:NAD-dependent succinate-semialdehyde dehydrogenase [Microbacterium terricola]UYK40067.1 NAD-dependent succinate-semialdehyde dehydrogenase [Microbacterium terricola]